MKKDIVYEVVCSQRYLDVGLLVEKDSKSKPKRIRAKSSTYSHSSGQYAPILGQSTCLLS